MVHCLFEQQCFPVIWEVEHIYWPHESPPISDLFTNKEIFFLSFKYLKTNTLGKKVTWDKDVNFCKVEK